MILQFYSWVFTQRREKKKTKLIQKEKCANVHSSIISDSQDMEAT